MSYPTQSNLYERYNDKHPGDLQRLWKSRREKALAAGDRKPCDAADSAVSKYLEGKGLRATAFGFANWRRKRRDFLGIEKEVATRPETLRELAMAVNLYANDNDIPEAMRPVIFSYAALLYEFTAVSVADFLGCSVSAVVNESQRYQGMEASSVIREINDMLTRYVYIHAGYNGNRRRCLYRLTGGNSPKEQSEWRIPSFCSDCQLERTKQR